MFIEVVTERIGDTVVASTVREATQNEVQQARIMHDSYGECNHSVIRDEPGFMYDFRYCAICGKGLGTV